MKKKYKIIVFLIILAAIILTLIYTFAKPIDIETVVIKKENYIQSIEQTATVKSKGSFDISSPIGGRVINSLPANTKVNKGDLLLEVDSSEFALKIGELNSQKMANLAQLSVNSPTLYQSKLSEIDISLQQLEIQKQDAMKNLERTKALFDSGAVPQKQFEDAQLTLTSIENNIKMQEERKNLLFESSKPKEGLSDLYRSNNAAIDQNIKLLQKKITDSSIKSPISGIITYSAAKEGEIIPPGQVVMSVATSGDLEVVAMVLADEAVSLKVGDEVIITQKTLAEDLTGKGRISEIANFAQDSSSALGISEKRVEIKIEITEKGSLKIASNYEVDIQIITFKADNVLSVPNTALFKYEDSDAVFVVRDKKLEIQKVEKGPSNSSKTLIKSGLQEDDEIVVIPDTKGVKEGARAR